MFAIFVSVFLFFVYNLMVCCVWVESVEDEIYPFVVAFCLRVDSSNCVFSAFLVVTCFAPDDCHDLLPYAMILLYAIVLLVC